MARYVDADALIEMLDNKAKTDLEMGLYNHGALTESFIRYVERQPTADVAPRAEVAEEIFNEITKMFFEKQRLYENSRQGGKANQMMVARCMIYKLRKKYLEGE